MTTDTQLLGKRERDVRLKFELPKHLDLQILAKYAKQTNKIEVDQSKK